MNRTNQILAILFGLQIVLAIVIFAASQPSNAQVETGPLLGALTPSDVNEIIISENNGESLRIQLNDDNEWVLPDAGDYPVQEERVDALLTDIAGLQNNRLIARNRSSHDRLQVADDNFQRRIEIMTDDDHEVLFLGSSGGVNARHTRVDGDDAVYLTSGLQPFDAPVQLSSWVDTLYFSVPRNDIVQINLENPNGTFEFKKIDDEWQYTGLQAGEVFDPDSINNLLTRLSSLRLTVPLGTEADAAWGMDDPQAVVTVTVRSEVETEDSTGGDNQDAAPVESDTTADSGNVESESGDEESEPEFVETTYTLRLGNQIEGDTDYVLISSESPYYVQVAQFVGDTFLNMTHDGLLVTEEESNTSNETP
ncbi:MAG: hypothetical protein CUN54_08425 [Phototrophicales bacterium]|nr:MAG: hypothetical protein CUN54_08425 [Phototrophicales bacterium]